MSSSSSASINQINDIIQSCNNVSTDDKNSSTQEIIEVLSQTLTDVLTTVIPPEEAKPRAESLVYVLYKALHTENIKKDENNDLSSQLKISKTILKNLDKGCKPKEVIHELSEDLLTSFSN